jgi:WD40 repeat protein
MDQVLPDERIVSGSWDYTLKIWNILTGKCDITLRGHTNMVYCVAILPDGRIVSGSDDGALKIWNPHLLGKDNDERQRNHPTGNCDITFRGHIDLARCVAVLPDGCIVGGSNNGTLKILS